MFDYLWIVSVGSKIIIADLDPAKTEAVSKSFNKLGIKHCIGPIPISREERNEIKENPTYRPEHAQHWVNLQAQAKRLHQHYKGD